MTNELIEKINVPAVEVQAVLERMESILSDDENHQAVLLACLCLALTLLTLQSDMELEPMQLRDGVAKTAEYMAMWLSTQHGVIPEVTGMVN